METGKTGLEVIYTERYKACFELYLSHGGRNLRAVEREMRGLGFADFHRRILYSRTERGVYKPGWIERFGWRELLSEPGAVATGFPSTTETRRPGEEEKWNDKAATRKLVPGAAPTGFSHPRPNSSTAALPLSSAERLCLSYDTPTTPRGYTSSGGVAADHISGRTGKAEPFRNANGQSPQEDFPAWLKRVSPELNWDWKYQKYIYKYLQRVTDGTCKRLMIFMPPRHGKSELVTIRYAGWRLWNDPSMRIIISSYNQKLADRFSRSIRRLLSEEEDKRTAAMSVPPASAGGQSEPPALAGGQSEPPALAGGQLPSPSEPRAAAAGLRSERLVKFGPGNDSTLMSAQSNWPPANAGGSDSRLRQPVDYPQCAADASRPGQSQIANRNSQITRMFPKSRTINTVSNWETSAGGGVKAVGVGAGVTGFGGQLVIIDDPVKSRAEAESETYRERLWDWYRNDLYTRLEPDAAVVLIQTRWHQDDLAGRLLQEMQNGGDQWEVINLPALSEPGAVATGLPGNADAFPRSADGLVRMSAKREQPPEIPGTADNQVELAAKNRRRAGEGACVPGGDPLGRPVGTALCPERFDETKLEEINRQLGSYNFSALYQQHPTPADGGIFKRSWFKRFVSAPPPGLKWKRGYDLAVSTKTTACYTASFRVAIDESTGDMYIDGGYRERIEYPNQRRYIIDRVTAERDTEHGIEKALHGQALMQDLRRDPRLFGKSIRAVEVTADKVTRALKWAPLAEEGKVILVRGPWNREFLEEIANFPAGQNDDQIDAVSLAVSMLQRKGRKAYGF